MDNNNRIGIGTNYPKHKLDITGDTNLTGNLRLNDSIAYPEAFLWTSVGPNRILSENVQNITDINENSSNFVSGPIECSVCHPTNNNIMFVGTVNGNIWKTENAQSNNIEWYVVNELSQTTITSIIFDTSDSNSNTMYASTGNKTSFNMGSNLGGIYKSTNGGNTWTFINIDNTKKVDGDTTIDDIQSWKFHANIKFECIYIYISEFPC